jgi:ABC-type multidrug transport system ATPase subunit
MCERHRRVEEVIEQLGLTAVANKLVGADGGGGLSPELRKRLSIGVCCVDCTKRQHCTWRMTTSAY